MGVNTKHPQYIEFEADWMDIQNALKGERTIKNSGVKYLPKTAGMIEAARQGLDGDNQVYRGYLMRAQYPEWVKDSTRSMAGLVARLEPNSELKYSQLEALKEQATDDGFSLFELFVRATEKGVQYGRYGLLADFADGIPYISLYDSLSIINWKVGAVGGRRDLTMVVLQELHLKDDSDEFSHDTEIRYRVLDLDETGQYRVRVFREGEDTPIDTIEPKMGSKRLNFIPFVFGGSTNNAAEPNPIPLLTMARSALKYYQLSADYFQSLYMTAHPQPWVSGVDPVQKLDAQGYPMFYESGQPIQESSLRVTGVQTIWDLPQGAEVGYLEIQGNGIDKTKAEMDSQRNMAVESGAKVVDAGANESGEARKARQDDQHASLHTIVQSASNAVQQAVRYLALWLGRDDKDVLFSVPLEFTQVIDPNLLKSLENLAASGRISYQTVWDYIRTGKAPEHEYLTEIENIEVEQASLPLPISRNITSNGIE